MIGCRDDEESEQNVGGRLAESIGLKKKPFSALKRLLVVASLFERLWKDCSRLIVVVVLLPFFQYEGLLAMSRMDWEMSCPVDHLQSQKDTVLVASVEQMAEAMLVLLHNFDQRWVCWIDPRLFLIQFPNHHSFCRRRMYCDHLPS